MKLTKTTMRLPAAWPPRESPLPILQGPKIMRAVRDPDPGMAAGLAYGRPPSLLPYTKQDGYDRTLVEREFPVVELENDVLVATFVPTAGGRLWSLVHRPSGRELLHRNSLVQPANLALRDAWLAGGVEWNLGTTGHWPLTCSPLHAVRLARPDGTPMLRMFEFERMRRLVVCIDAWLPKASPVLFVQITIRNPGRQEAPVYWWSNVAVPEAPDVRVVAPARQAYYSDYAQPLRLLDYPEIGGIDRSYTDRVTTSSDYFFKIPDGERPWIAALDGTGRGLVQTSTGLLRGRKLFHWGVSPGGRHWQEWLGGPADAYLEIQAGLARTQLEHLPIAGQATWTWVEAYGLLEADPGRIHGMWDESWAEASRALDRLVPAEALDAELAVRSPAGEGKRIATGSG